MFPSLYEMLFMLCDRAAKQTQRKVLPALLHTHELIDAHD